MSSPIMNSDEEDVQVLITIVSLVHPEGPSWFQEDSQIYVQLQLDVPCVPLMQTKCAPASKDILWEETFSISAKLLSTLCFNICITSAVVSTTMDPIHDLRCTIEELMSFSEHAAEIPFPVFASAASATSRGYLLLKAVQLPTSYLQVTWDNKNDTSRQSCCEFLHEFAVTLWHRFHESSDIATLDRAIDCGSKALKISDSKYPPRALAIMVDLAEMHLDRVWYRLGTSDLERASSLRNECQLLGVVDPNSRPGVLLMFARTSHAEFGVLGGLQHIDLCIQYAKEALSLCQTGHPDRVSCLYRLARYLSDRYRRSGDWQDSQEALKYASDAKDLCPSGNLRAMCLDTFATVLYARYASSSNTQQDMDRAIETIVEVLHLRSKGHYLRPAALEMLGGLLYQRACLTGSADDLDASIRYHTEALDLKSPNCRDRVVSLNSLGNAHQKRFNDRGHVSDLDAVIDYQADALRLRPLGHPRRFVTLNNSAVALLSRFKTYGDAADLDKSIQYQIESLELRPLNHPYRNSSLGNLGEALLCRYSAFCHIEDLDMAINYYTESAKLCPPGHIFHPTALCKLAEVHRTRYENSGNVSELDDAICLYTEAYSCLPESRSDRAEVLLQLAENKIYRFHRNGDSQDLGNAFSHLDAALDQISPNRFDHAKRSKILGEALLARYHMCQSSQDLEHALQELTTAESHLGNEHPFRHSVYSSFTAAYSARYALYGDEKDQAQWFRIHQKAAEYGPAGLPARLTSSLQWISDARDQGHPSELLAFNFSLTLLDQYMMLTPALTKRYQAGKVAVPPSLTADAAACAIETGQLETAIQLLEQGRALIWAQLARFRTSLDALRALGDTGCVLADRYKRLSVMLEQKNLLTSYSEDDAQQYRTMWQEWKSVVEEIRQQKGFACFLQTPPYSELAVAAQEGPVIIVNISLRRCDALIITNDRPLCLIPLQITMKDITRFSMDFEHALASCQARGEESFRARNLVPLLRKLWRFIVHPVVQRLQKAVPRGSRIWWCPTNRLATLPLHAAGPYRKGELNLPELYVSSFTSTLSALIQSRKYVASDISCRSFLAVGQPKPYDSSMQDELHTVDEELQLIESLLPPTMSFHQLVGEDATRDAVLQDLHKYHWVHLACHGSQDVWNPYHSSFSMRDKPLCLTDVIQTPMIHPEFAFLSACHTARGDIHMPDEVIHMAAALQFSGFRSVIGTIGAVDDGVVTHIVKEFYKNIFSGSGHFKDAATSLNRATRRLRKKGIPLDQRVTFIHIGA